MPTVPDAVRRTLGSVTTAALIDDFHTYLAANPGNFTISNVIGSPVTSFTLTHTDSWQINLRLDTADLKIAIAPTGGIADSSAPSATDLSPEEIGILDIAGNATAQYLIAIFDDAITLLTKDSANSFIFEGLHAGKIMTVGRANFPALGRDGLGMLCGKPFDNSGNINGIWFSSATATASRRSKLHIATSRWGSPVIQNLGLVTQSNDSARFPEVPCQAAPDSGTSPSATTSPHAGVMKYITGDCDLSTAPLSVINSAAGGSTQAYLALNYTASNTRLRLLWKQGVAA